MGSSLSILVVFHTVFMVSLRGSIVSLHRSRVRFMAQVSASIDPDYLRCGSVSGFSLWCVSGSASKNYADPDPAFHFDADPDPVFHFDADPDQAFHFDADPDRPPKNNADPDPQHTVLITRCWVLTGDEAVHEQADALRAPRDIQLPADLLHRRQCQETTRDYWRAQQLRLWRRSGKKN